MIVGMTRLYVFGWGQASVAWTPATGSSRMAFISTIECEVSRDGIHSYVLWLEEKKHGELLC